MSKQASLVSMVDLSMYQEASQSVAIPMTSNADLVNYGSRKQAVEICAPITENNLEVELISEEEYLRSCEATAS